MLVLVLLVAVLSLVNLQRVFGHNIGDEDKLMAVHGKISYFNSNQETWSSYTERLGYYFAANDVHGDDKKKAILITVCGPSTFDLLKSLLQPQTTNDKTYTEIIEVLNKHFSPTPSVIMQRYKFNTRTRKDSESVATYVAELKRLGEHCQFGDKLHEMVRDRLVCGVNDIRIQNRLLQESSLTYEKAFEIAQSIELAAKDAAALHKQVPVPTLPIQQLSSRGKRFTCYRCGGNHLANSCNFQKAECRACGKIGHIAKVCKSRQPPRQFTGGPLRPQGGPSRPHGGTPKTSKKPSVHTLTSEPASTSDPPSPQKGLDNNYTLFTLPGKAKPLVITVNLNGSDILMELDTGASLSIISEQTFHSIASPTDTLQPTDITLTTYTGHSLTILGTYDVEVRYKFQVYTLPLVVVQGHGPSLFGRNWLEKIKVDWNTIHTLQHQSVSPLLDKYAPLFADKLGLLKDITAKLYVDPHATPKFFRARPVPYRLKEKVEIELDRLQSLGIISPVQHSEWATPVVPIMKRDGNMRLCGDYKVTVNRALTPDSYPLPRVEDIFAALQNGKLFSKLDLSQAYQQLPLDEDSKKFTTINTHKGLFQYERLPFGISTAPSIFQRLMENLLRDLPNVCVYIDDILVSGKDEADHLHNLEQVLTRLTSAGITLKRSKCVFATTSVEYLGHIIDSNGLHPSPTKVQAIQEAPAPTNLTELRAFLGLVNYYHKILPNLSNVLAPLHSLLCKGTKWTWTDPQQTAFDEVKQLLQSSSLLVHYDSEKPLLLHCDASPYGVGAVLSHKMSDNTEKPIAFASRTLSPAERNYSQLEKEALAIIFGVKRFHQYLYGTHFTLYSDHKPLERIFSESQATPSMASARIQRWALTLAAYQYTIRYKPGRNMSTADALSRLPIKHTFSDSEVPLPGDLIHLLNHLEESIVTATQIKDWTDKDPLLSRVRKLVENGWNITEPTPDLTPFHNRYTELSVLDGCLLLGCRVIIPTAGRKIILDQLHQTHPGISKMKMLARSYVWWPGIDSDIQRKVQHCNTCQVNRSTPAKAPLHFWEFPRKPWSRVHIDHAGPFLGKLFLIVIDAHSKWLEVHIVKSTSSEVTIHKLQQIFSTHGLPEQLVSDNGTAFTSHEFRSFMKQCGIQHICSSPYHPSSNGLAERAVQTFKAAIKKLEGNISSRVIQFLARYRVTPHSVTEASPAELLMGRKLRTTLDLIHPDMTRKVSSKQTDSKSTKPLRQFSIGQKVFARNYRGTKNWVPAEVIKVTGPVSYKVKIAPNIILRRHIDQLRIRYCEDNTTDTQQDADNIDNWSYPTTTNNDTVNIPTSNLVTPMCSSELSLPPNPTSTVRRSTRLRRPVDRFGPFVS